MRFAGPEGYLVEGARISQGGERSKSPHRRTVLLVVLPTAFLGAAYFLFIEYVLRGVIPAGSDRWLTLRVGGGALLLLSLVLSAAFGYLVVDRLMRPLRILLRVTETREMAPGRAPWSSTPAREYHDLFRLLSVLVSQNKSGARAMEELDQLRNALARFREEIARTGHHGIPAKISDAGPLEDVGALLQAKRGHLLSFFSDLRERVRKLHQEIEELGDLAGFQDGAAEMMVAGPAMGEDGVDAGAVTSDPGGAIPSGPQGAVASGPQGADASGPQGAVASDPGGADASGPQGAVASGPGGADASDPERAIASNRARAATSDQGNAAAASPGSSAAPGRGDEEATVPGAGEPPASRVAARGAEVEASVERLRRLGTILALEAARASGAPGQRAADLLLSFQQGLGDLEGLLQYLAANGGNGSGSARPESAARPAATAEARTAWQRLLETVEAIERRLAEVEER